MHRPSLLLVSALLSLVAASVTLAASPAELWVAFLAGHSTEEALQAGIRVRDELPTALIVDDAGAAAALRAAGWRVDGPRAVPAGHDVLLLAPRRGIPADFALDVAGLRRASGVEVLWADERGAIVATDRPLPHDGAFELLRPKVLSFDAIRPAAETPAPRLRATSFDSRIADIIADVDSVAYFPWIRKLSGAEAVTVGGSPVTLTTRYTHNAMCRKAEQYVYERFQAMGLTDVIYDPFQVNTTWARNVVATLPGVNTPGQVVIVCGHLDSTSENPSVSAPGANDNASGTAGVLAAAEALKEWSFDCTIRFVAFTGEEQGLYGSEHYAALVAASPDTVLGVVNMDMIAYWSAYHQVDVEGRTFAQPLMFVMRDALSTYTTVASNLLYYAWGSDHVPFLNRGMPAFLAIETDYGAYPCYHRTCDTIQYNLGGFGSEVVRAAIATAAHLAGVLEPVAAPVVPTGTLSRALEVRPNPFDASLAIRLPSSSGVPRSVVIHDVAGRCVRTLARGVPIPDELSWDGRADDGRLVPGGIYFVRLSEGDRVSAVKVVRLP